MRSLENPHMLEFLRKGEVIYSSSTGDNIINGCSSFIAQEELDRFTGMWWSPGPRKMLLYEQVDETAVTSLQFTIPGCSPARPMKYPVAGTANAVSTLRLIVIDGNKVIYCLFIYIFY